MDMDANELSDLLRQWADEEFHTGKPFIYDGIIDPEKWAKSFRKVLLLLKEAYPYDEKTTRDGFDLCSLIKDEWKGVKYKMWKSAAYWCHAVQHTSSRPLDFCLIKDNMDALSESLLSSAVVNIKKSDGHSVSDDSDLKHYVDHDHEKIRKQVDLIGPNIVICCNTWHLVKDKVWPETIGAYKIYDRVWKVGTYHIIDYWHPANQFPDVLQYYGLNSILMNSKALE